MSLTDAVREKGVVGCGGAGFPTYKKLERPAEVVILNAAECEPLLHKDKEILRHHAVPVLDGMAAVMAAVEAREGVVAVKGKYEALIAALEPATKARGIRIHRLGDFYPSGDEFVTVHEATGRVVPPGGIPLDVGCLVTNVETMLNLASPGPVTHKHLTVAGAVPRPVTVRVPVGTSFRDLLTAAGADLGSLGVVLVGGVMMGRPLHDPDEVVTRTTGGLVCLPPGHRLGERHATEARQRNRIGKAACDQCSFCTELCPRYLLGHPVRPHVAMRNLLFPLSPESQVFGSQFCCECNLCSLFSCPEELYPKDACVDDKRLMRERKARHPMTGRPTTPHGMQAFRHVPLSSLFKKLGLGRFENVGPLTELPLAPERVRIPLLMHIGQPAVACVRPGQRVEVGTVVGRAPEGLGVPVHASLAGTVESVGQEIVIRRADA